MGNKQGWKTSRNPIRLVETIALIICSLLISLEDFRFRLVRISWYVLLFCVLLIGFNSRFEWIHLAWNTVYISLVLWSYYSLKTKKLQWPWKIKETYFGWGDVLMMAILAGFYNFDQFVLLIIVASIVGGIGYVIWHRKKSKTIPFAGYLSFLNCAGLLSEFY